MYIPNLDPYSFTGTAVILGYLLTNDFTTSEQAALGAWFNVVGDILASNSSWSAVLEERSTHRVMMTTMIVKMILMYLMMPLIS